MFKGNMCRMALVLIIQSEALLMQVLGPQVEFIGSSIVIKISIDFKIRLKTFPVGCLASQSIRNQELGQTKQS